jgi:hypothetical protein
MIENILYDAIEKITDVLQDRLLRPYGKNEFYSRKIRDAMRAVNRFLLFPSNQRPTGADVNYCVYCGVIKQGMQESVMYRDKSKNQGMVCEKCSTKYEKVLLLWRDEFYKR